MHSDEPRGAPRFDLENLQEACRAWEAKDGHVELDTRIADELLDVGLVSDPLRDEFEPKEIAIEGDRRRQVRDLDSEVADSFDRPARRTVHIRCRNSPIRLSGSCGPCARSQSGSTAIPNPKSGGSGAIRPSVTTGLVNRSVT